MRIGFGLIVIIALLNWNCGANSEAEVEKKGAVVSETLNVDDHIEKEDSLLNSTELNNLSETENIKSENNDLKNNGKAVHTKLVETNSVKAKSVSIKTVSEDFSVDYLMGKFDPNTHTDFTSIKSMHASRSGMKLRKDAYASFEKMYNAALKDGVRLTIISATRPFNHQKTIWEAKWQGKRQVNGRMLPPVVKDEEKRARLILQYSSMPGTSRHHWGTDIDLNDLNNPYFEKGTGKKIYDWLVAHAHEYGFCQVYSEQGPDRPNGYLEEKWHWSYVPVARRLTEQYKAKIKNTDITGFEGSNTAVAIDMVNNFVLGINPVCK